MTTSSEALGEEEEDELSMLRDPLLSDDETGWEVVDGKPMEAQYSARGPAGGRRKDVHWVPAGLIIFGFSAPAALVGVPFAVGQAGVVLGLCYCLVVTAASVAGAAMLLRLAQSHPHCQNLPELGRATMGRGGELVFACVQNANFVLFLPVSLLINAQALQGVLGVSASECVDGYILAVSAACFLTTQARVLANTQALALASLAVVMVAAAIELGVVFSTPNPDRSPAWLVGHPPPPQPEARGQAAVSVLLGLTTFSWSYVPAFLTIELSSSMARPLDFHKSLALSSSLAVLLFLIVGVPVVSQWGWDVPDPVYLTPCWPAHRTASRVMQACILASNLVAYALDSVPLARYCQLRWMPWLRLDDWSCRGVLLYALCSLPAFAFALIASVTVGNLLSLLAFVTALTVPLVTQLLPGLAYLRVAWSEQHRGLSRREAVAVAGVLIVGAGTFAICMAAAIGKVAIKELRGPTVIGCGTWTIYSDQDSFRAAGP